MADETPTCPRCGKPITAIERMVGEPTRYRPCGHTDLLRRLKAPEPPAVRLERHASNGDDEVTCILHAGDDEYSVTITEDAYTLLVAALDPATTATLFDQRDAAIERAKALERELADAREEEDGWMCAAHQREEETWKAIDERDQALAEVERMRPVLEAARALAAHRRTDADPADATDALLAAVDVYNQPPTTPKGDDE